VADSAVIAACPPRLDLAGPAPGFPAQRGPECLARVIILPLLRPVHPDSPGSQEPG
jgi:hypothetical protein